MLIGSCKKRNILGSYLLKIIWFECEKQKSKTQVFKPTTQLYMDIERVENVPSVYEEYHANFEEIDDRALLSAQNKVQEEEFDF